MKKITILLTLMFALINLRAQTEKELIGKWKLVSWKKASGKEVDINKYFKTTEVYQVFNEGNKFESLVGDKITRGTWKLSDDNKTLTIISGIATVPFSVDLFTDKKRIISSSLMGVLEYDKQ